MAVQMIFCVETNKRADTDSIYITELIRDKYLITNQVRISKVYMGSKSRYNSKEVLKEIQKKTKDFTIGQTKVIYCIDTDEYEANYQHKKGLEDITQFCQQSGYDLIWFCHDVEDVFLGKRVPDSQKVKEAAAFRKNYKIKDVKIEKLSGALIKKHTSNILNILDKYLQRK